MPYQTLNGAGFESVIAEQMIHAFQRDQRRAELTYCEVPFLTAKQVWGTGTAW